MSSSNTYCYAYPRPSVTVDVVLICEFNILLIKRRDEPFKDKWALPGGYVDSNEDLKDAAQRELLEETGITIPSMKQLGAYGKAGRDPRGHVISIAFISTITKILEPNAGDDAKEAKWWNIHNLPDLAFDHSEIIRDALAKVSLGGLT